MDEPILNNTERKLLPAWYYDAFAMRIMGLTHRQIAEKTGMSESRVKMIFSRSGPLHQYYRNWVETNKADVIDESLDMAFGHLPEMMRAAIMTAKKTTMPGVIQRDKLFDLTIGKPEERIKLNATIGIFNFTDWAKAQAQKMKQKDDGSGDRTIIEVPGEAEGVS